MDLLGLKDLSRYLQTSCTISYFLPTFNTLCIRPKIRCNMYCAKKKLGPFRAKQGLSNVSGYLHLFHVECFSFCSLSKAFSICRVHPKELFSFFILACEKIRNKDSYI
jgi:hypothetical protein